VRQQGRVPIHTCLHIATKATKKNPYSIRLNKQVSALNREELQITQSQDLIHGWLGHILGQGLRGDGVPFRRLPISGGPLPFPAAADLVLHLVGVEPDQLHRRLVSEQQVWKNIDGLNSKEGLEHVEEQELDEGDHKALSLLRFELPQIIPEANLSRVMKELIQKGASCREYARSISP